MPALRPGHHLVFPVAPSGDGRGNRADARTVEPLPVLTPNLGTVSAFSGDGQGRVFPEPVQPGAKTVRTAKGEVLKLVMLVVFFLLWISTASTLLFLYMDRYLFPG